MNEIKISDIPPKIDAVRNAIAPIKAHMDFLVYFVHRLVFTVNYSFLTSCRHSALFEAYINEEIDNALTDVDDVNYIPLRVVVTALNNTNQRLRKLLTADDLTLAGIHDYHLICLILEQRLLAPANC
jgi:hypothetical protein